MRGVVELQSSDIILGDFKHTEFSVGTGHYIRILTSRVSCNWQSQFL